MFIVELPKIIFCNFTIAKKYICAYFYKSFHRFIVVSEFQEDLGSLNWLYNDTSTPTCHYIDERGTLMKTTEGIDPEYLEKEFLKIK